MTVGELRRMLARHDDDAEVRITPEKPCGGGFPEWRDARVIPYLGDVGIVTIELQGDDEHED